MSDSHQNLSVAETAALLKVSRSTVKNWVRHEYLHADLTEGRETFREEDVKSLIRKIKNGKLDRLQKRANKKRAVRRFLARECLRDTDDADPIGKILTRIKEGDILHEHALFMFCLNLCSSHNIATGPVGEFPPEEQTEYHAGMTRELRDWYAVLDPDGFTSECRRLLLCDLPDQRDVLGVIFQGLRAEGAKSRSGSYYTPQEIVKTIVRDNVKKGDSVLDPCCGTGQFLIEGAVQAGDPRLVTGYDIDPVAVRIARINLILEFPEHDFTPDVACRNFLFDIVPSGKFDAVITNPPWGAHFEPAEKKFLKGCFPEVKSGESFSCILAQSISVLKDKGKLSFLLPESFLNVKIHQDIRTFLQDTISIRRIELLGRLFTNVFTPVIRLDLVNTDENVPVILKDEEGNERKADPEEISGATGEFAIIVRKEEFDILNKVYEREHHTLADGAVWGLGIVTGNNNVFLSDKPLDGYEPIISGVDISPFRVRPLNRFLNYDRERLQQCAPDEKYRTEKLVYRFISDRPVCMLDTAGRLTLNSANIVIPDISSYTPGMIMLLLNSALFGFVFRKQFASLKVLKRHLQSLPLPVLAEEEARILESEAVSCIRAGRMTDRAENTVFNLFGIDKQDREIIIGT